MEALPVGAFRARALGRDWMAVRTRHVGGASQKIVARALGGDGYVSANLYALAAGPRLKPCEMPAADVMAWLEDAVPLAAPGPEALGTAPRMR